MKKNKAYPFGDLILWLQLIDHAQSQKKPVIFTIDDSKEDWWRRDKDRKEKILVPRPELIQEIYAKAYIPFYMYLADEFIRRAQKFLKVDIHPGTIKEVKETREQQEQVVKISRNRDLAVLAQELEAISTFANQLTIERLDIERAISTDREYTEGQLISPEKAYNYNKLQLQLKDIRDKEQAIK